MVYNLYKYTCTKQRQKRLSRARALETSTKSNEEVVYIGQAVVLMHPIDNYDTDMTCDTIFISFQQTLPINVKEMNLGSGSTRHFNLEGQRKIHIWENMKLKVINQLLIVTGHFVSPGHGIFVLLWSSLIYCNIDSDEIFVLISLSYIWLVL